MASLCLVGELQRSVQVFAIFFHPLMAQRRNGELYAITYTAPRLAFFGQHLKSAEAIAASARLKS